MIGERDGPAHRERQDAPDVRNRAPAGLPGRCDECLQAESAESDLDRVVSDRPGPKGAICSSSNWKGTSRMPGSARRLRLWAAKRSGWRCSARTPGCPRLSRLGSCVCRGEPERETPNSSRHWRHMPSVALSGEARVIGCRSSLSATADSRNLISKELNRDHRIETGRDRRPSRPCRRTRRVPGTEAHLSRGTFPHHHWRHRRRTKLRVAPLRAIPGVAKVIPILPPFKLASREAHASRASSMSRG